MIIISFVNPLQSRLQWWPNIEIMYGKASELRNLFTDTLNKVTQLTHPPLHKLGHMGIPYKVTTTLLLLLEQHSACKHDIKQKIRISFRFYAVLFQFLGFSER